MMKKRCHAIQMQIIDHFVYSETNASFYCNSIDLDCSNPNLLNYHPAMSEHCGCDLDTVVFKWNSKWNKYRCETVEKPHAMRVQPFQFKSSNQNIYFQCVITCVCVYPGPGRSQYPFPRWIAVNGFHLNLNTNHIWRAIREIQSRLIFIIFYRFHICVANGFHSDRSSLSRVGLLSYGLVMAGEALEVETDWNLSESVRFVWFWSCNLKKLTFITVNGQVKHFSIPFAIRLKSRLMRICG